MKKFFIALILFVILGISFLVFQNERMADQLNRPLDNPYLTEVEINEVKEILRLQRNFGNLVWPGFGDTKIPVLLYNDKYQFLVAEEKPSPLWETVEDKNREINGYYRRIARNPQDFTVRIGDKWVGSLGILQKINKSYFLGIRSELPPVLNKIFPYQFATISVDFHIVAMIHEMFHAFQAEKYPEKFTDAGLIYKVNNRYPYHNEKFIELWNEEGKMLARALESGDEEELKECLAQFISIRKERRKGLAPDIIEYEKRIEWLEGLAKYVESKTYELAANANSESGEYNYKKGLPYWQQEIARLKKLGEVDMGGDFRFYISGMAQARLLDKLGLEWKDDVMQKNLFLEDLIIDYLGKR